MELADVQKAVTALRTKVGARADVYLSIDLNPSVAIYANGIGRDCAVRVRSEADDTFASLLAKAEAAWDEHVDQFRAETIRAMALAIIEITAAQGRCSDAALRMKFPVEDIERYSAEAVRDANEIAANGPFEIVSSRGANGAPDEVEAATF